MASRMLVALFVLSFLVAETVSISGLWCALRYLHKMNYCSARKMYSAYRAMRRANCKNCDWYFHCKGNYDAVYNCGGNGKKSTAKKISDCRDPPGSMDYNSMKDREANEYGRNGNDCGAKYLCKVKCKWSPTKKTCRKDNCHGN